MEKLDMCKGCDSTCCDSADVWKKDKGCSKTEMVD